jgi:radical SAM protein with 4Fe4S-binding SPASM domain
VQNLSHSFSDTDPAGAYAEIRAFAAAEALWATPDPATIDVFARAKELAEAIGVDLRLPRLEEPPTARPPAGTPGCSWPWDSSYVTHDGKVQPCCMVMGADRAVLGDATEDGFADIWRGDEYGRFRDGLMGDDPPDVCRGCSLYRRLF